MRLRGIAACPERNSQGLLIAPNPRIDSVRGCLAIQRGPLVYCLEDQDQPAGISLMDIRIDPDQPLQADWSAALFGGITIIHARGYLLDLDGWDGTLYRAFKGGAGLERHSLALTAIPYYAWANRGPASMRVWIPRLETDTSSPRYAPMVRRHVNG
jgi:DUF1680 family protein